MIRKEEFDKIVKEFVSETGAKVFIFGSRARGDNYPSSDIDIGIMYEKPIGYHISILREKFENSNIPYKVDVVDLEKVDEKFRREILKEAVRWEDWK